MGSLSASAKGCAFSVPTVDPTMTVRGYRDHLLAALMNLLQNAFKFTHPNTEVTLRGYAAGDRVLIDVVDHCGGLLAGFADKMFQPLPRAVSTGADWAWVCRLRARALKPTVAS